MFKITAALLLLALPANAGGLTVKDCALRNGRDGWMDCTFTNETNTPIAMFTFETTINETGRTVPWVKPRQSSFPNHRPIMGGLEPSEAATLPLNFGYLDKRANLEKLVIDVVITGLFDVNGAEIAN
jgi:hypothetical protein